MYVSIRWLCLIKSPLGWVWKWQVQSPRFTSWDGPDGSILGVFPILTSRVVGAPLGSSVGVVQMTTPPPLSRDASEPCSVGFSTSHWRMLVSAAVWRYGGMMINAPLFLFLQDTPHHDRCCWEQALSDLCLPHLLASTLAEREGRHSMPPFQCDSRCQLSATAALVRLQLTDRF